LNILDAKQTKFWIYSILVISGADLNNPNIRLETGLQCERGVLKEILLTKKDIYITYNVYLDITEKVIYYILNIEPGGKQRSNSFENG
jgi:hypothetical protein